MRLSFQMLLAMGLIWATTDSAWAAEGGFFGLQVQELPERVEQAIDLKEPGGVLVRNVALNGPANQAGLLIGDHIVRIKGQQIADMGSLIQLVRAIPAGTTFKVEGYRNGDPISIDVTLGEWPPEWQVEQDAFFALPIAGITVAAITPKVRERFGLRWENRGLVITIVDTSRPMGSVLKRGDVIHQINFQKVWEPAQLQTAYQQAKQDGRPLLLLLVETAQGKAFKTLPVP